MLFSLLVRYWFASISRQNEKILSKLDMLVSDFHQHKIDDTASLSRLDANLINIYKRLDREHGASAPPAQHYEAGQ